MHHSTHGNSDGHHWYADFIILCFLMTHFKELSQAHTIVYLKKYNSKIPTFTPNLLNQNIESLSTIRRLQENKMFKKRPPLVASQYNKYKTTRYKNLLGNVSKEYKNTISRNVKRYKNEKIKKLKTLKNAKPREFWKIINSINETAKDTASLDDLFTYFKNINAYHTFDENEDIQSGRTDITNTEATANMNLEINQPFTEYEIIKTVKNLKNNKSPGIDSIINEHMKTTINVMAPIYVKLFNLIFDSGFVPDSWTLGNILPIYKNKGNINLAENYRPITLLSCLVKVFTAILNDRITK